MVLANACWLGGLWSDAEHDTRDTPQDRRATTEGRCRELLRGVYGSDDNTRLEQLRAFESSVVGDVAAKVEQVAANDPKEAPQKAQYSKLVLASAAAQRTAMEARRAADRVKRDMDREPDKLTKDDVDAVAPLTATKPLEALLSLDAGDLSADAKAIGYVVAMDHVALSRGLPKHLKVYALEGTLKLLFGAAPPDMPTDASKPLVKGTYLKYLTDVAKAAGHPVPDTAKEIKDKEALAWAGVLEGIAEKIKANMDKVTPNSDLYEVSGRIANRLTLWYDAEKQRVDSKDSSKKPSTAKPKK
jgi:hypothetical protein